MTEDKTRYQRTKLIKLCLAKNIECNEFYPSLQISPSYFAILKACHFYLHGKDDKAEKLTRESFKQLNEIEKKDSQYELVSAVQAYVEESIQWITQSRKISLFERLSENV